MHALGRVLTRWRSETARRVAIDQLVMSPIFLAIYFAYNAAVDGSLRGHFWRKMDSVCPPPCQRRL